MKITSFIEVIVTAITISWISIRVTVHVTRLIAKVVHRLK